MSVPAPSANSQGEAHPAVLAAESRAAQVASPVSPLAALPAPDAIVLEGRRKFHLALEDELLDYRHNHPIAIENCATTLLRIFDNVIEHPGEDKFSRVKASSNVFKNNVTGVRGGEKLMMLAGWKTEVVEMQKYWVFDGLPGSHKHAIMQEGCRLLHKALATIHEKAERKRHESEVKTAAEKQRMQSVMSALEEDRQDRRLKTLTSPTAGSHTNGDSPAPGAGSDGDAGRYGID